MFPKTSKMLQKTMKTCKNKSPAATLQEFVFLPPVLSKTRLTKNAHARYSPLCRTDLEQLCKKQRKTNGVETSREKSREFPLVKGLFWKVFRLFGGQSPQIFQQERSVETLKKRMHRISTPAAECAKYCKSAAGDGAPP